MSVLKITAFILLCVPVNLYAQKIYKWVDKQGKVTYSNKKPPKGMQEEKIETLRSLGTQPAPTPYAFKSNSSIPTTYNNPYQTNNRTTYMPPRQPDRTAVQEAERQALLKAASTPYKGSQNGQLTAAQLRTQAALNGVNVSSGDSYSYPAPIPQRQPSTISNCDGAGCWGSDGTRYNKAAGDTYFPSTGGSCQSVGGQMQCN